MKQQSLAAMAAALGMRLVGLHDYSPPTAPRQDKPEPTDKEKLKRRNKNKAARRARKRNR